MQGLQPFANPNSFLQYWDSYGRKVASQSTEYAYEFYLGQNVSDVTWITLTSLIWAYRILSILNYLKRAFENSFVNQNSMIYCCMCLIGSDTSCGGTANLIRAKYTCHH